LRKTSISVHMHWNPRACWPHCVSKCIAPDQWTEAPVMIIWFTRFICFCSRRQQCIMKFCAYNLLYQNKYLPQERSFPISVQGWLEVETGIFLQFLISRSWLRDEVQKTRTHGNPLNEEFSLQRGMSWIVCTLPAEILFPSVTYTLSHVVHWGQQTTKQICVCVLRTEPLCDKKKYPKTIPKIL
jgi:hypothetical protein